MRKNDSCRIHAEILKSLSFKLTELERLACQKGQFTKLYRSNPFFELPSGIVKKRCFRAVFTFFTNKIDLNNISIFMTLLNYWLDKSAHEADWTIWQKTEVCESAN